MANYQVPEHLEGLLQTFTEMMTGNSSQENVETVLEWAIYMHIRNTMPPLVQHWGTAAPEESAKIKAAILKVKSLNEDLKLRRQVQAKPE